MAIVTLGIDLAKNVFALHGVDATGKAVPVHPRVPRGKLVEVVGSLAPCLIGMEACSGAHHWARLFPAHGHTVRLMAPKFVAPYRLARRARIRAARARLLAMTAARSSDRKVATEQCLRSTRPRYMYSTSPPAAKKRLINRHVINMTVLSTFCGGHS